MNRYLACFLIFAGPALAMVRNAESNASRSVRSLSFEKLAVFAILGLASLATGQASVIHTIPVGQYPDGVAVDTRTNLVYVAAGRGTTNELHVIDGNTNAIVAMIPVGNYPNGVVVNEALDRVYVANHLSHTISVIDSTTDTELTTIPTPARPNYMALNPVTNRLYTANVHGSNVSVIDVTTNTLLANVTTGDLTGYVAVNTLTNRVYACAKTLDNVAVIDGATNNILTTIAVGVDPNGAAVDEVGNRIYVSNTGSNTISVIDGVTNTVVHTISLGTKPGRMAIHPTYGHLYVSTYPGPSSLLVFDTDSYRLVDSVPTGNYSVSCAVNPVTDVVYVTNVYDDRVAVVQAVPPCAYHADPDLVLCDDFSGTDPLSSYAVTTPRGGGQNAMGVYVDSGRLIFEHLSGWSVAIASHHGTFDFRNSTIEGDVRIDGGGGACGLEWVGDDLNRFQVFMDLGADNIDIDALVAGAWLPRVSGSYVFDADTTYRLRMEVELAQRVLVYVDDVLVIDTPLDLAAIPALAHPSFVGFTHGPGDMVFDDLVVLSRVVNQPPVAEVGADQTVDEGTLVELDGAGSSDPEDDPLTYFWSQIAGTPVVLDETDPASPTFTAPWVAIGGETLTFQLIVHDGALDSDPVLTNVTVKNLNNPPEADAGLDQMVQEGVLVTLDGTGSFDEDDDPLTYAWTQLLGTAVLLSDPTSPQPDFTAPLVGQGGETLIFELVVNDGQADSVPDPDLEGHTVLIEIENVNHPPVAMAGDPQTVDEETTVWLDGTGSSDPDQDTLTYDWIQLEGPPVALSDPSAAEPWFQAPGVVGPNVELVFELSVFDLVDLNTNTENTTVTITVLDTNAPPDCALARSSVTSLWPPNHKLKLIAVTGISDPDNDAITVTITGVTQDEPVDGVGSGDTSPDAVLQGDTVLIRAERAGGGNGRVYVIGFEADDGQGGVCTGSITVCVPHSKRAPSCPDDGQLFDSTSS